MDIWTEIAHMNSPRSGPIIFLGLACAADTDFMLIAGGFDGNNRLNSTEILRIRSTHTVSVEPMPLPRSNFGMCKMGNYFYAIGGYNISVIKTVIRFDGKKWERICDISVPRSALRVALLIAWPDPVQLLYNASKKSRDGHNTSSNTESSESSEISNLKIVPINDDLD
ncbi:Kelch-like ECH-associated protein 1A [Dirofilaria immitis]|nr:Kelch-like protein 10 [Dirofilaria immitis]